jgi:hypothetical protein
MIQTKTHALNRIESTGLPVEKVCSQIQKCI